MWKNVDYGFIDSLVSITLFLSGPDSFIIDWFSYYFCCTRSCLDRIRICALYLSMRVFT